MLRWIPLRPSAAWWLAICLAINLVRIDSGFVRAEEVRSSVPLSPEVQRALERGESLERDGRWTDALVHYEEAFRANPKSGLIERRLFLSRTRFDLARRYTDSGFVASLQGLNEQEALEIYTEVLLKIHTHFVNVPNWQALVKNGATNIELALAERAFVDRFAPKATSGDLNNCRRGIRYAIDTHVVNNRFDARSTVFEAARAAKEMLGIPPQVTIMEFICGAVNSLDEYSNFLTHNQLDEVFSQIEGNFVGLGVELKAENQALLIVSVIPGGPADVAGICAGERIISVDEQSTREISTDTAADMLKGTEGSRVAVGVLSSKGGTRHLSVERRKIEVPCVDRVAMVDKQNGVGYVRLTTFQKSTSRDIDAALWKLHKEGMKILITDLRGNPGGLLTAAVEVADKFISSGTIVSTRGRNAREDADYKAHVPGTWRIPLIVLIDGDSASASEIFAAAIHDTERGTVIGQRSYGKGSVQGIFPLSSSNVGVRLTTAKFYSPKGEPISGRGVTPNIVVQSAAKPIVNVDNSGIPLFEPMNVSPDVADPVLAAAITAARNQMSRR